MNREEAKRRAQALVDQKEMVEIKHDLLVRRQKLRSKIAFNLDIVKKERAEIIKALRVNEEARTVQVLEMIRSIDKLSGMEEKA